MLEMIEQYINNTFFISIVIDSTFGTLSDSLSLHMDLRLVVGLFRF